MGKTGGPPQMVDPQNGWLIMEHPIKMDDLGYPYFKTPPRYGKMMIALLHFKGTV